MQDGFFKDIGNKSSARISIRAIFYSPSYSIRSILFICNFNSARSQISEAFLKRYAAHQYDAIIELCDKRDLAGCPSFPGVVKTLHWLLPDPATFQGSDAERLQQVRELREQIRQKVADFVQQARQGSFWVG